MQITKLKFRPKIPMQKAYEALEYIEQERLQRMKLLEKASAKDEEENIIVPREEREGNHDKAFLSLGRNAKSKEKETMEEKKMSIIRKVKEPIKYELIEEGEHQGTITGAQLKEVPPKLNKEGFTLIEYFVNLLGTDSILRFSVGDTISEKSKAGKLLKRFGFDITPGKNIDFEVLVGKNILFTTTNVEVEDKEYSNIIVETVRPMKV